MQKKIQIERHGVATLFHKEALQFVLRWLRQNNKERRRFHVGWIESVEHVAANCPLWPPHMVKQDWNGFHSATVDVAGCHQQAPELAETLLFFLQRKWRRLEGSKLGQLKKYFSHSPVVKWEDSFNWPTAVKEAEEIRKICDENEPKFPMVGGSREVTQADWDHLAFCRNLWAKRRHSGPVPDTMGNVPIGDLKDKNIQSAVEKLPWGKGITVDDVVKARKWVVANQNAGKKFAAEILDDGGYLCVGQLPQRCDDFHS